MFFFSCWAMFKEFFWKRRDMFLNCFQLRATCCHGIFSSHGLMTWSFSSFIWTSTFGTIWKGSFVERLTDYVRMSTHRARLGTGSRTTADLLLPVLVIRNALAVLQTERSMLGSEAQAQQMPTCGDVKCHLCFIHGQIGGKNFFGPVTGTLPQTW